MPMALIDEHAARRIYQQHWRLMIGLDLRQKSSQEDSYDANTYLYLNKLYLNGP